MAGVVLRVLDVIVIGDAEAVGSRAVLVVDNLGVGAVLGEAVGGMFVVPVTRGGNTDNVVALGEDDDVFPVVFVATGERAANGLVLQQLMLVDCLSHHRDRVL